jgi:hypothetical protein
MIPDTVRESVCTRLTVVSPVVTGKIKRYFFSPRKIDICADSYPCKVSCPCKDISVKRGDTIGNGYAG